MSRSKVDMMSSARQLTCWTVMIAYLSQVLVLAQGGVLCFGEVAAEAIHNHSHIATAAHCHGHDAGDHDHNHSGENNDTERVRPFQTDPHHCPCAHMHVSTELGRTGDRVQLVSSKQAASMHLAAPSAPRSTFRWTATWNRVFYDPPVIKQTKQILRSTVLLV